MADIQSATTEIRRGKERKKEIQWPAENDGGKKLTATLNTDVILRMHRELCDV